MLSLKFSFYQIKGLRLLFQGHFGALEDTLGQISKIAKSNYSFDHKYSMSHLCIFLKNSILEF